MNSELSFEALPLAAPLQRALREKNYSTPSEIQARAIPHLVEGKDLLGAAQTGTGKTAAFALPILHRMHEAPRRLERHRMRALVLTPTRELAVQVANSFEAYGKHLRCTTALVYGGVSAGPQIRALKRGVDVLVATPGRLLDLYGQGYVDFSGVDCLVLDEADRMLDMGFINDIRKIVKELPAERQSLFFSATMSSAITRLANEILTDPVDIRIAPEAPTADKVDHRMCFLSREDKFPLLTKLLQSQDEKKGQNLTLVFSRTKHGANRLAKMLDRNGTRAAAIHGNKSQAARQRALESFRKGKAPVLVATDVAARGIDVKNVTLVVNFDLPDEPEAYVHRIGRTARAGADGSALSFCTGEDFKELRAIQRLLRSEIPVHTEQPYHIEDIASRASAPSRPKNGGGGKGGYRGRSRKPGGPRARGNSGRRKQRSRN